ncbi:MAG: nitrate/nitrite transporter NrtS [Chloroflexi bacterium]|nr:nitrate/nitrite transporter NrtS [Chloroflexota bacterium]
MKEWLSLCFTKSIIRRAVLTSLVVGAILIAINHGSAILAGEVDADRLLKIALTALVPYLVSTLSSVSALMDNRRTAAK